MRVALLAHFGTPADDVAPVVQEEEVAPPVQAFDAALNGVVDACAAQVAVDEVAAQEVQLVADPTEVAPLVQIPEVAPVVQIPTPMVAPRGTSKGLKIQKDRPSQNGVRMPSEGGLCRAVWDYLQNECDHGRMPTAKDVKAYAATVGWNTNNASIEFYNWRKYNGISGRQS
jgi:hypothetical protein